MTDPCEVTSIVCLGDGGSPDWGSDGRIVYMRWNGASYQVYTITADGQNKAPASPVLLAGLNVCGPTWHPSGRFLVAQVEMVRNPLRWLSDITTAEMWVNGLWSNLVAIGPRPGVTWPLTDYSNTTADGAMCARFSPDGTKMLWSRLVQPAGGPLPFGAYRLMLADVVDLDPPHLGNVQDITPPGAHLIEAGGFTANGEFVYFTSDIENTHTWGMDIYRMDLATRQVLNVTQSPHWEEHPNVSRGGGPLVYMSSEPYGVWFSHTELMLRKTTGVRQLTHFNDKNYPEYQPQGAMPCRSSWSPDGTQLVLETQASFGGGYPARKLWVITFAGACGA